MNPQNRHENVFSATGTSAMVATPHYLASQAGAEVLKAGGSAVDAAVAANLVLCVVYPHMCGIGGDLFAQVWDPDQESLIAINGTGRSGENASRKLYYEIGARSIPARGALSSITVPGAVHGWGSLHQKFGKLPWSSLFESAIEFANGFPLTKNVSDSISENLEFLQLTPDGIDTFTRDAQPLKEGEFLVQEDLAESLALLAKEGPDVFYQGILRDQIVEGLQQLGGLLSREDFSNHQSTWVTPIQTSYHGYQVSQMPPNSQGLIFLMLLNMLEKSELSQIKWQSPDYFVLLVDLFRRALPDLERWVTDPAAHPIPLERLISKEYAAELVSGGFKPETSKSSEPTTGDTVYISVVDSDGMAVSLMQSIFREFGSGIMPAGTGILLQNRGSSFSLDEKHANRLEPGKLPSHTLMPAMVLKENKPWLVFGTMGGEGQAQTLTTILTSLLDFGLSINEAIQSPRWFYGRMAGDDQRFLYLEDRMPHQTGQAIESMGQPVKWLTDFSKFVGHAQAILIDHESGLLHGAADRRADGEVCGW